MILAAVPLVFAAKLIAPFWLIVLFETKVIFEPLAPVMAPVWVIPVFEPAAALLPIILMLEPPAVIVIAPNETIVVAVLAFPVTLIALADIAPASTTAELA